MDLKLVDRKKIPLERKKILFLGYDRDETCLIDELIEFNCEVKHTKEKIEELNDFDLIISFGYRHLINKKVLQKCKSPIINLHISLLPWNRGSHPNFWSFFDNTPSGVTIHLIDEGIDTGDIIYQKLVNFSLDENTFIKTQKRLVYEIEKLFIEYIENIILGKFKKIPQDHLGTFHRLKDLPKNFSGWHSNIKEEILRLKNLE